VDGLIDELGSLYVARIRVSRSAYAYALHARAIEAYDDVEVLPRVKLPSDIERGTGLGLQRPRDAVGRDDDVAIRVVRTYRGSVIASVEGNVDFRTFEPRGALSLPKNRGT